MLLNDIQIERYAREYGMITPYEDRLINKAADGVTGILSYGQSSYGYDLRLGDEIKVFQGKPGKVVNCKRLRPDQFSEPLEIDIDDDGLFVVLPPHTFALGHSVEQITLPRHVTALVTNKSTPARCGINNSTTVGEAEWSGHYTFELYNMLSEPNRLYINEGICQILFLIGEPPRTSYADRKGKYQNQGRHIVLPKV